MISAEIDAIANGDHSNPHNFLGMHSNNKHTVVRAFIPNALRVICINIETGKEYPLNKSNIKGFFELSINSKAFKYIFKVEGDNTWEVHDPYSFAPIISEYDIYLFKSGTHYNVYDKLGANIVTINGVEGVLFGVWAPNAKRVSVVGSFNNWDGRTHSMSNIYSSGIFEIFIPGLKNYDMYKFEIKAQNGDILLKSDPYAKFSELRPGKASFIYDISGYKWNDSNYMKNKCNTLEGPLSIYEVHLGSWRRDENNNFLTYTQFANELVSYVVEMGFTHIELLPIAEHPLDLSWGYQLTGFYSVTSRFGNPHEFMYFIDMCHQAGIGVILDWVPAHFPKDSNGLTNFDGTALYEHDDIRKGEHIEWGTKIFNYGRKEVSSFLISNAIFWAEIYHIDGFRVDAVSSMLYLNYNRNDEQWIPNKYGSYENEEAIEFLKHLNSVLVEKYPNILLIAEESTSWPKISHPVEAGGLGFNLKWNMGWMNDFLRYISKDPVHRSYHHNNITFAMMYAHTENFILVLSHDEVVHGKKSLLGKMPGDIWQKFANLRVSFSFMYGHPGKKLIFMGGEFGQFIEWDESRSLDWHLLDYPHHLGVHNFVLDLNKLYKNVPALWCGDFSPNGFKWISVDDSAHSILVFARFGKRERDAIIIICNFTPVVYEDYKVGVPIIGTYREILNSDDIKYGGSGVVNYGELISTKYEAFGYEYSVRLRIPPLGAIFLKVV